MLGEEAEQETRDAGRVGEPWVVPGALDDLDTRVRHHLRGAARRATLDCRSDGIFELPRGLPALGASFSGETDQKGGGDVRKRAPLVRHYKMGAGSIDSLMHHVDEEFGPALTQEPGFVCYFALDTGDETVETISIFHDKASADRSNELAAEYVRDNLREFELTRTGVTAGEVLVSRVAPEALEDEHHPLPSRKAH